MNVIEIESLAKTYRLGFAFTKRVHALRGINLEVREGEAFGLIGPNGAGKSTAIKILLNLLFPTSGQARLFGVDVRDARARRQVGYVPENPVPYEYLTGREFLRFQADLIGSKVGLGVEAALERVEMAAHASLQIRKYSKGMVQRVMLASALLGEPRLLILDEPTSGLDPLGRRLVRDIIVEQRAKGVAILFCTHIISDVESLCDRVALLLAGQVVKEGKVSELVSASRTHEIVVRDEAGVVQKPAFEVERWERVGANLLIHLDDARLQETIAWLVHQGAVIQRVGPVAFSLEDQVMQTMRTGSVGGQLQ